MELFRLRWQFDIKMNQKRAHLTELINLFILVTEMLQADNHANTNELNIDGSILASLPSYSI